MIASVKLSILAKTKKDEAIRMLSKHYFFKSFSAILFMTIITFLAAVDIDLVILGVFLIVIRERWILIIKSLNSYIKNIPFIYFIHLSLAYSLSLLHIINIAERRGELRGEKISILEGEKWSKKISMLGDERWIEIIKRESRLFKSQYSTRT